MLYILLESMTRPCAQGAGTHTASVNQVGFHLYMVHVYRRQSMVSSNMDNKKTGPTRPQSYCKKKSHACIAYFSISYNTTLEYGYELAKIL